MIEYKINSYSMDKMYEERNQKNDKIIELNEYDSIYSIKETLPKKNCLLFDIVVKMYGEKIKDLIPEIFIIVDFSNFNMHLLDEFDGGIKLFNNKKQHTYINFLKSNSMSKKSQLYYIDKNYYDEVIEKIGFGFNNVNGVPLAKWYAYSGLLLSDADIINNFEINEDEIIVVDDVEKTVYANCITAISKPYFYYTIKTQIMPIIEKLDLSDKDKTIFYLNNDRLNQLSKEFNCYKKSIDYKNLEKDMQEIIDKLSIINTIKFNKLNDYLNDLMEKTHINVNEIDWIKMNVVDFPINVNFFDGEGLICTEYMSKINIESSNKNINHSVQIRLPFVKGILHECDFKQYFIDNKITKITVRNSYNKGKEHKVLTQEELYKVKIILTESQFKAATFLKKMENGYTVSEYFKKIKDSGFSLGVSGYEYESKNLEQLNYQFLATLPVKIEEMYDIIDFNYKMINKLTSEKEMIKRLRDVNSISYNTLPELYDTNKEFYKSLNIFKNERKKMFESIKTDLSIGKLYIPGTRRFISADLLMMLHYITNRNKEFDKTRMLKNTEFYAPQFEGGDNVIILRNPHYSRNEILLLNRKYDELRDKYFSNLKSVIFFNPLSLNAERLGGADYDGDSVCIIYYESLINKIKNRILSSNSFILPLVKIPSLTKNSVLKPNYKDTIDCLSNTFSNRIGQISDLAFTDSIEKYSLDKAPDDVAFYTILGGLEIDSVKNGTRPLLPRSKFKQPFLQVKNSYKFKQFENGHFIYNHKEEDLNYILENDKTNNLYSIFKLFYSLKLYSDKKLFKAIPVDEEYIKNNKDSLIEMLSILEAYDYISNILGNYNGKSENAIKTTEKHICSKLIMDILENKYVNVDDFTKNFKNSELENPLHTYCTSDIKYHYLTDYNQKINYIKDVLKIDLNDEKAKEAVTDFNRWGYRLLYLTLRYNKIEDTLILINNRRNNDKLLCKSNLRQFKLLDEIILANNDLIIEKVNEIINQFKKLINEEMNKIELLNIKYDFFKKLAKKIDSKLYFQTFKDSCASNYFGCIDEILLKGVEYENR